MDEQKFEGLLREGKIEEALNLIDELLEKPLTEEEQGEMYLNLIQIYLRYKTSIGEQYLEELKEAIESLSQLDKESGKMVDDIDLKSARDVLK